MRVFWRRRERDETGLPALYSTHAHARTSEYNNNCRLALQLVLPSRSRRPSLVPRVYVYTYILSVAPARPEAHFSELRPVYVRYFVSFVAFYKGDRTGGEGRFSRDLYTRVWSLLGLMKCVYDLLGVLVLL